MIRTLELIPDTDTTQVVTSLFPTPGDYASFRESFMNEVIPRQEEWMDARRKSEEEARQRLLR